METREAKEIISAGLAWANWTEEQKEAMKLAWTALDKQGPLTKKVDRYEKALKRIASDETVTFEETEIIAKRALELPPFDNNR